MNPTPEPTPSTPPSDGKPQPQYEFDEVQNKVIDDLAAAMRWVGIPLIILGVLFLVAAGVHLIRVGSGGATEWLMVGRCLLGAAFFLALYYWVGEAQVSFFRVTHTQGYDITHLMHGLQNLRKLFRLLATLVQIYIAVFFAILIVGVIIALGRAAGAG